MNPTNRFDIHHHNMLAPPQRRVLPESWWLLLLCTLDAIWTAIVIKLGWAIESNPLLAPFANSYPALFALTKIAHIVLTVAILEFIRHRYAQDRAIRFWMRLGIIGYLALYIGGTIAIH